MFIITIISRFHDIRKYKILSPPFFLLRNKFSLSSAIIIYQNVALELISFDASSNVATDETLMKCLHSKPKLILSCQ